MPKAVDLVAEFKKGIKRDASLYPVLKDQRHWNNWQHSVLAQAHVHDIQEVFDTEYYPLGDEQEKLISEKNKFAYTVLNRVVQTDEGKAFVRRHEKDNDAQAVYRKLVDFASKTTADTMMSVNAGSATGIYMQKIILVPLLPRLPLLIT